MGAGEALSGAIPAQWGCDGEEAAGMRKTMSNYRNFIISDPNILFGKPAIKGTRISVEHILDELAGGITYAELLEEYPHLTIEAIYAALAFAADTLRAEVIYPLDETDS